MSIGNGPSKMRALSPDNIHAPFGSYSHGVVIPKAWRVVKTSGQLGIAVNGDIPDGVYEQACICFENVASILAEASMTSANVVHVSAYVTDRDHFPHYMRARDEFIGDADQLPGSTLLIVSGFTKPEFKVEVEVTAAAP